MGLRPFCGGLPLRLHCALSPALGPTAQKLIFSLALADWLTNAVGLVCAS